MHNHGPEEGRGLNCNEIMMDDGVKRGVCLIEAGETPFDKR